jgi:type II secretory pathway component PulJ
MNHAVPHPVGVGRRQAGFTLAEVLLSVGITAVIALAMTSVMVMAQRGLAGGSAAGDCASKADRAMQMILQDVNLATSIPERTDKAITVVVPDRNGDGNSETIRYNWSGTAGDPLTRQINGGTAAVLAENVYQLRLTYLTRTLSP